MPHLRIETNISKDSVAEGLAKELCKLIAELLGKPENYCCVTIVPDQVMVFGGTDEPCGQCLLMSIGQLGQEENMVISKALFHKISDSLGIPATRMYITFHDEKSMNVGYNGTTFYEIFGGRSNLEADIVLNVAVNVFVSNVIQKAAEVHLLSL